MDGSFGSIVPDETRTWPQGSNTCDVDHVSTLFLLDELCGKSANNFRQRDARRPDLGHKRLRREKDALNVDVKHSIEFIFRHLDSWLYFQVLAIA